MLNIWKKEYAYGGIYSKICGIVRGIRGMADPPLDIPDILIILEDIKHKHKHCAHCPIERMMWELERGKKKLSKAARTIPKGKSR